MHHKKYVTCIATSVTFIFLWCTSLYAIDICVGNPSIHDGPVEHSRINRDVTFPVVVYVLANKWMLTSYITHQIIENPAEQYSYDYEPLATSRERISEYFPNGFVAPHYLGYFVIRADKSVAFMRKTPLLGNNLFSWRVPKTYSDDPKALWYLRAAGESPCQWIQGDSFAFVWTSIVKEASIKNNFLYVTMGVAPDDNYVPRMDAEEVLTWETLPNLDAPKGLTPSRKLLNPLPGMEPATFEWGLKPVPRHPLELDYINFEWNSNPAR